MGQSNRASCKSFLQQCNAAFSPKVADDYDKLDQQQQSGEVTTF